MIHMNQFSRLGTLTNILAAGVILAAGALPLLHTPPLAAQLVNVLQDSPAYLLHASQGYLGVDIRDVDSDRAVALKLKDSKGAEVVTVDHDAPAGKAGLQSRDVILQMNGQVIEGAEQLRRMLHETPSGRAVNLVVSRDGQQMSLTAQLVDRRDLEHEIWGKHVHPPDVQQEPPSSGFFDERTTGSRGFVDAWSLGHSGSLSVGAVVDPLGAQLANYFGVTEGVGLLVKSVGGKSPAAAAGLKAGDIVLKINEDTMATRADWERVLLANQGKQVQLTVLREKKQQQLTMQAGNLKKKGALEMPEFCPGESGQMVADLRDFRDLRESLMGLDPDAIVTQAQDAAKNIDVDAIRAQAEQAAKSIDLDSLQELNQVAADVDTDGFREQLQQLEDTTKNIDVDAIRAQADQATKQLESLKKQLEEMKQQLDQTLPQPSASRSVDRITSRDDLSRRHGCLPLPACSAPCQAWQPSLLPAPLSWSESQLIAGYSQTSAAV